MDQQSQPLGSAPAKSLEAVAAPSMPAGPASQLSDEQLAAYCTAQFESLVLETVGSRARGARILVEVLAEQVTRLVDRYGQICAGHFLLLLGDRLVRRSQIRIAEHEAAEAKQAGLRSS